VRTAELNRGRRHPPQTRSAGASNRSRPAAWLVGRTRVRTIAPVVPHRLRAFLAELNRNLIPWILMACPSEDENFSGVSHGDLPTFLNELNRFAASLRCRLYQKLMNAIGEIDVLKRGRTSGLVVGFA